MSWGFSIYNDNGQLELDTTNAAGLIIDVIQVTKGVNGSKNYSLGNLKFILIPLTGPQLINDPGTNPRNYAKCNVSTSGTTVSWNWDSIVHYWAYQNANIYVIHSD